MTASEPPYRLGRAERRGHVLGWRPGQALAVALGAGGLVLGLASGSDWGTALGVVVASLAGGVAALRVRGRGLDEWVPVAAGHLARLRRGALCAGATVLDAEGSAPAHLRWPDGTATSVARLEVRGLAALDDDPRAIGEALATWLRTAERLRGATVTLLTVTRPGGAPPRDAPFVDPGVASTAHVAVSAPEPVDVASQLAVAGVPGVAGLDGAALRALLSARVAPTPATLLDVESTARWRWLEGPGTLHAAFLVEEWPAGAVDEQVLAPLCVARDRRSVVLHLRVEDLARARERTAAQRTAAAADASLRRSGGFLEPAAAEHAAVRDAERAHELAAGHAALRLVGVVGVDATDALALEAACARLVADAASIGMRLRRCDGDHRRGVLATVPGWCVP